MLHGEDNNPLIYFLLSFNLTLGLYLLHVIHSWLNQSTMKNIINDEITQLVKIYDKINGDINKFTGDDAHDLEIANKLTTYFERKYATMGMMRINIKNHFAHISNSKSIGIRKNNYKSNIVLILNDFDSILETCYDPKLPSKYQLSLWRDKRDFINSLISNTISIVNKELKLS